MLLQVEEYLLQIERFNLRAARDPARELVSMALDRWRRTQLRSDNISVLTVAFRSLLHDISPDREVSVKADTEEISESADFSPPLVKSNPLNRATLPSDEENNLLRLPLNHLNQVECFRLCQGLISEAEVKLVFKTFLAVNIFVMPNYIKKNIAKANQEVAPNIAIASVFTTGYCF